VAGAAPPQIAVATSHIVAHILCYLSRFPFFAHGQPCRARALARFFLPSVIDGAVLGTEDDNGNFLVQDCALCYAGVPPTPPAHQLTGQLLFVSGLRLGGSASDAGAYLLLEWLAGFCGSMSGSISACVVLGNCCAFRWIAS
jgi:hypothetical protein